MSTKEALQLFGERKIRTAWSEEEEKWFFSIIDVVAALTDSTDYQAARNYWKVLKNRLKNEGNETVTNCNRLKLLSADGKMRQTDVADQQQLFRLILSIPSPKQSSPRPSIKVETSPVKVAALPGKLARILRNESAPAS
jgi:hypothetical protein